MIRHRLSHVDHVPPGVVELVLEKYKDRDEFFVDTFTLPDHLPELECAMYGPTVGDPPVPESEVVYEARIGRAYMSRLVDKPCRPTRTCTVVGGPSPDGDPCVLYTVYGGPAGEVELHDPALQTRGLAFKEKAAKFWAQHALAR